MTTKEQLQRFIKEYEETKFVASKDLIDNLKDAVKELEEYEELKAWLKQIYNEMVEECLTAMEKRKNDKQNGMDPSQNQIPC